MFIGHSPASVDPKGRVHLPAKFRDVLVNKFGEPLILTISDRCLAGYPANYWLERYDAVAAAEYTPEKGDLLRAITENAEECPIKNGRILLPSRLREYAGIERDVVIVGRIKMIEVWAKDAHDEITGKYDPKTLSAKLREIGF
jgi:MraZ protein